MSYFTDSNFNSSPLCVIISGMKRVLLGLIVLKWILGNRLLRKYLQTYDKPLMLWERNNRSVYYIIFIFGVIHRDGSKC